MKKTTVFFTVLLIGLVFIQGAWAKGAKQAKYVDEVLETIVMSGKFGDEVVEVVLKSGKYGDEIMEIILKSGKYGDEFADLLLYSGKYSDELLETILKRKNYSNEALKTITKNTDNLPPVLAYTGDNLVNITGKTWDEILETLGKKGIIVPDSIPYPTLPYGGRITNIVEEADYRFAKSLLFDDINDFLKGSKRVESYSNSYKQALGRNVFYFDELIDASKPLYSDKIMYNDSLISRQILELLEASGGNPKALIGKTISDPGYVIVNNSMNQASQVSRGWKREMTFPKGHKSYFIGDTIIPHLEDYNFLPGFNQIIPRGQKFEIIDAYYDINGVLKTIEKAVN